MCDAFAAVSVCWWPRLPNEVVLGSYSHQIMILAQESLLTVMVQPLHCHDNLRPDEYHDGHSH